MPGPLDPNSQQGIMAQILGSNPLAQPSSAGGMMSSPPPPAQSMMNAGAPSPMALAQQVAQQQSGQSPLAPGMPGNPTAPPITTAPTTNPYGMGQ
jgi:hypothetical protein